MSGVHAQAKINPYHLYLEGLGSQRDFDGIDKAATAKAAVAGALAAEMAKRETEHRILQLEDELELTLLDRDHSAKMKKTPETIVFKI